MYARPSFCLMGALFYSVMVLACFGQSAAPSQVVQQNNSPVATTGASNSATLQSFQAQRQSLARSELALISNGASPAQIQAWQQQNSAALAAQRQQAAELAANSALQPMATVNQPTIPANASQTLKDFLTTHAALANARAQIHNQLLSAMPSEVSDAQLGQMQQTEAQLFQQQEAATLQLQVQRAQALASASAQQPIPLPPPLVIPANASPQLAAFLTARDQLMRAQLTLTNQNLTASPAARQATLQQWQQQNAARFQQVHQLAENLRNNPQN